MDACADWVARAAARIEEVTVAGVALYVVIAFLALFWAPKDRGEGEDEDMP
jgi:hypothetical protein